MREPSIRSRSRSTCLHIRRWMLDRGASLAVLALPVALLALSSCASRQVVDAPEPTAETDPLFEDAGEIVPRQTFFDDPDRAFVRLSPDGTHLSYLAPSEGALNVWVAPVGDLEAARPVTEDTHRGIRNYYWAYTSRHILFSKDDDGDENWTIYRVDLEDGETLALTPPSGVNAHVIRMSSDHPEEALLAMNDRDPSLHDIHRVNLLSGRSELVIENPGFVGFLADNDLEVRLASRMTEEGGQAWLIADEEGGWAPFVEVSMEDIMTTSFFDFDRSNEIVHLIDSRGRDTAALASIRLESGEHRVLHADPRADVNDALFHPTTRQIQAAAVEYARAEWTVLDPAIEEDLARLAALGDGDIEVLSRTLDDRLWIAALVVDDGPLRYYLYDREAGEAEYLFSQFTRLEGLRQSPMKPVVFESRDGLNLVGYLTIPHFAPRAEDGLPIQQLPMVLNVHGGPWARDSWGYRSDHQWLADRGYVVLSVNFRGSTGFGKSFINAANKEWGGAMHDDLIDAIDWAVEEGIADPDRVAIMGGSYGGYAALVGLTMTPEVFACGVDIVGPSNLVTLLETIPPYWEPMMELWTSRVGDHRTEEGREFLMERSPLTHVENIQRPLLIAQGAHDPRVKQSESDQIVEAMQEQGIPVTYVLYPDEGHGFARPANRISFFAITEAFLSECLGGRFEPVGDDFEGSSLQVPEGAGQVPGLIAALEAHGLMETPDGGVPGEESVPGA